ncbi:MAG: tryptophan-rich sensory protein [Bacteroidetes bacterium]|nr:tryptophan-rich sensory protein [Bacteroidota bacterium]
MVFRVIVFLVINFAALGVGGFFTGKGVPSDWYMQLNKAPWTPPGWVFGAAWTAIMICFSFYMAYWWELEQSKKLLVLLFVVQWFLNVLWNPTFFYFHQSVVALVLIVALTVLVTFFLFSLWPVLKYKSAFILPYFLWLLIATSLNAYIVLKN